MDIQGKPILLGINKHQTFFYMTIFKLQSNTQHSELNCKKCHNWYNSQCLFHLSLLCSLLFVFFRNEEDSCNTVLIRIKYKITTFTVFFLVRSVHNVSSSSLLLGEIKSDSLPCFTLIFQIYEKTETVTRDSVNRNMNAGGGERRFGIIHKEEKLK